MDAAKEKRAGGRLGYSETVRSCYIEHFNKRAETETHRVFGWKDPFHLKTTVQQSRQPSACPDEKSVRAISKIEMVTGRKGFFFGGFRC